MFDGSVYDVGIFGPTLMKTGMAVLAPIPTTTGGNMSVLMERSAWPDGPVMSGGTEYSLDDGATWQPAGTFTLSGGAVTNRHFLPETHSGVVFNIPPNAIMRTWLDPVVDLDTSVTVTAP